MEINSKILQLLEKLDGYYVFKQSDSFTNKQNAGTIWNIFSGNSIMVNIFEAPGLKPCSQFKFTVSGTRLWTKDSLKQGGAGFAYNCTISKGNLLLEKGSDHTEILSINPNGYTRKIAIKGHPTYIWECRKIGKADFLKLQS